jgi:hypothetical protein
VTRKAWPALAIGTIVSMTRLARAEATPLALELEWEAPPSCPDATVVRRQIETILHGPPTALSSAVAHGKIDSTDDGRFHLSLTVRTGDVADTRELDAASCAMLSEAFAVVVALAIDPTKGGGGIEEPPQPASPPPEPIQPSFPVAADTVPPSSAPPSPAPRPPEKARSRAAIALGVGGSLVWGILPETSPGLVASAGLRIERFRVGMLGTLAFGQRPQLDRSVGAAIDMIEGGAFAAYMVPIGILALGPCANIEATYVRVEGYGVREPRRSSTVWATPVLGGRFEARASRWLGLFARADVLFPIDAPRIALGTRTETAVLHSPAPVSSRLTLGAEIILP